MDEVIEVAPKVHSENSIAKTADGRKVSMKNSCFDCSYALYWCKCKEPKAVTNKGYERVYIT